MTFKLLINSIQGAPVFIRKIVDTQVVEKKVTKLEAEIQGVPKPKVTWYKNGQELHNDDHIQHHDAKGGVYQLTIKNSRKDDTGVYVCKAVNEIGTVECSAQLVIEMTPQFLKKLEKLQAVESCDAEWSFQLIGIPRPTIQLSRNGEDINLDDEKEFYSLDLNDQDNIYTIKFNCVRKKDVGNWTCSATNSAGKASCIAKLETLPLSAPKFLKELSDIRLPEDLDGRLDIKVSGIPFPHIEWFKDDKKIALDSKKYKFERDMNTGLLTLIITNCDKKSDSGVYSARIYNPGGEAVSIGNVFVKGHPPKLVEKPEKVYALANEVATFACVVEGDPQPEITWFKGRNEITASSDVKIYYDDLLDCYFMEILKCKTKDAGTYQVTASNIFGSDTAPVTLIITQNPEDVVDPKKMLKNRSGRARASDEEGPDWGKLKKGGPGNKNDDPDALKYKLRHVEFDQKPEEATVKEKPNEEDRSPFEIKEFGPRDKTQLEKYEPGKREKSDDESGKPDEVKKKPLKKSQAITVKDCFTKELVDLSVPEHKLGVFECAVSNFEAQVKWFFKDQPIESFSKKKKFQVLSIGEFRRLAIRDCLMEETESRVTCKWGDLETSGILYVTECPIIFIEGLKNLKVPINSDAILECQIKNNLAPVELKFKWKKNDQEIDLDAEKDKFEFIIDGDRYKLKIKNFNKNDQAKYEIFLTEPDDFDVSSSAKIDLLPDQVEEIVEDVTVSEEVLEAEETIEDILKKNKDVAEPEPKFDYKLKDCHVKKHEQAVFELKIPDSRPRVKWLKNGKPIPLGDKFSVEQSRLINRLIVNDCFPEDEDKYTAVVEDQELAANLTVEDFNEILKALQDQVITEKESLKLSVQVSDKNIPGYWFKDGKPIEPSDNIIIESLNGKHELTIKNSDLSDAGVYKFVSGDAVSEARVKVNGNF